MNTEWLALILLFPVLYVLSRCASSAYFSEKLLYHKRLLEAMKKEEDQHGKQTR